MQLFIILIVLLIFGIIIIFAFPQFSPVPYFPSNEKDMPLILDALHIRNNQTVIDLGAGDGIVIFKAAEKAFQNKLNTQFIAVEINPVLLIILHLRRLFHPNRKNIRIVNKDMFGMSYADSTNSTLIFGRENPAPTNSTDLTFYIYISPWFIEKTVSNIQKQVKAFDIVSYFYQVKCLPNFKEQRVDGVHKVFSYHQ